MINRIPLPGLGLGIGTNVGARALIGHVTFLLAENEWSRVLLESGPILGLAFIIWRTAFVGYLGWLSLRALGRAEILPLLLFSTGFIALLNGQLGQPTSLGFAVVLCGLCLASMRPREIVAAPLPSTIPPRIHSEPISLRRAFARCAVPPLKPMVLLIGNFLPDQQQSMQRFSEIRCYANCAR